MAAPKDTAEPPLNRPPLSSPIAYSDHPGMDTASTVPGPGSRSILPLNPPVRATVPAAASRTAPGAVPANARAHTGIPVLVNRTAKPPVRPALLSPFPKSIGPANGPTATIEPSCKLSRSKITEYPLAGKVRRNPNEPSARILRM